MTYYRLFVQPECQYCESAITYLQKKNETYVAIQTTAEKLQKIKNHYDWPTMPIIIKVGDLKEAFVGGCSDLTGKD